MAGSRRLRFASEYLLYSVLEEAIRLEPSQWFWLHKRWRD